MDGDLRVDHLQCGANLLQANLVHLRKATVNGYFEYNTEKQTLIEGL